MIVGVNVCRQSFLFVLKLESLQPRRIVPHCDTHNGHFLEGRDSPQACQHCCLLPFPRFEHLHCGIPPLHLLRPQGDLLYSCSIGLFNLVRLLPETARLRWTLKPCRPVIYFLLLGTIVYQFFPNGKKVIIDSISWRFPLLGVLSAVYINIWATNYYIVGGFSPYSLGSFFFKKKTLDIFQPLW